MTLGTSNLKVIGFSVPTAYAERVDAITRRERRTKRAVFEAMVDLYEETLQKRERLLRNMDTAIQEALREKALERFDGERWMSEWTALAQYGSKRAQALGMTDTEIDAMAYAGRSTTQNR